MQTIPSWQAPCELTCLTSHSSTLDPSVSTYLAHSVLLAGWFPVSTRKVLLGMQKAETLDELISREGRDEVGVLTQLLLHRDVDNHSAVGQQEDSVCKVGRGGW